MKGGDKIPATPAKGAILSLGGLKREVRWMLLGAGLTVLVLLTLPLHQTGVLGAVKYGDATIQTGTMEIIRDGAPKQYSAEDHPSPVEILQDDLIRVGENSKVHLDTVEKTAVTLGSNSILHINAWRRKEKTGLMRMLYGRLRAEVVRLLAGERFSIKTSSATIGVKGTDFYVFQAATGSTVLVVTSGLVEIQGLIGIPVDVLPGRTSVATGRAASTPVPTTEPYEEITEENNLEADPVENEGATDVPDEPGLIDSGATTESDLEESKQSESDDQPAPEEETPAEESEEETSEATDDSTEEEIDPASTDESVVETEEPGETAEPETTPLQTIIVEPTPPPEPEIIFEIRDRLPINIEVGP